MASPFPWGPWGPIMNALTMGDLDLQQAKQNLDASKALTGLRTMETQLYQQQIDQQKAAAQVFARTLAGGPAAQTKSVIDNPDDTPVVSMQKQSQRLMTEANNQLALATDLANNGALDEARKQRSNAMSVMNEAYRLNMEARREQQAQAAQTASIAGQAVDEPSFQSAMAQLRLMDPKVDTKYLWDRDASGKPIWGETSQRSMHTLDYAGIAASKQADLQIKAQDEKRKAEEFAQKKEVDEARIRELNAQAARARAGTPGTSEYDQAQQDKLNAAAGRLKTVADKAPTKTMIDASEATVNSYIQSEYAGAKFDPDARRAFAGDVAARANKIRADAAKDGEDVSLDDARYQAIEQLKPYIIQKSPATAHWFKPNEPATMTYRRTTAMQPTMEKAGKQASDASNEQVSFMESMRKKGFTISSGAVMDVPQDKAKLHAGQVYNTPKGLMLWDGSKFQDGKA